MVAVAEYIGSVKNLLLLGLHSSSLCVLTLQAVKITATDYYASGSPRNPDVRFHAYRQSERKYLKAER
jgi:hypothetical protein